MFRDLGALEVVVDGTSRATRGSVQRDLLALLLIHHGTPISGEALVELLWPDELAPVKRLWFHASRVRTLLEGLDGVSLTCENGAYVLRTGEVPVESEIFRSEVVDGLAWVGIDLRRARSQLEVALGRWRGEPHLGVDLARLAPGVRSGLHALFEQCHEAYLGTFVALGDAASVVTDLETLVSSRPYDDVPVGLLARARYALGRRGDALELLRNHATSLRTELGLEPGAGMVELECAILNHDVALSVGVRPPTYGTSLGPAPSWRNTFVGRASELTDLADLVSAHRMVTVTGPGGVGKTRLVAEGARQTHRWRDRLVFVDLTVARQDTDVVALVAAALGLDPTSSGVASAIANRWRGREAIIVLDNCEHVRRGAAELAEIILLAAPSLSIVATSREPLRVCDEYLMSLSPLQVELPNGEPGPAMKLFTDRARLDSGDDDMVKALATHLDGLPLALELAAARVAGLGLDDLLSGLDDRFAMLTVASNDPTRHDSLRVALDWSFDLASTDQQRLFRWLAVFAGGFCLEDVVSVCGRGLLDRGAVAPLLGDLVDRCLVVRSSGDTPYRLLENLRHYGLERLQEAGELSAARSDHLRHFAEHAPARESDAFGPDEAEAIDHVMARTADYRVAVTTAREHGDWDLAAEIVAGTTGTTFFLRGTFIEASDWLYGIDDTTMEAIPRRWPRVLAALASRAGYLGDLAYAARAAERAHQLAPKDVLASVELAIMAGRCHRFQDALTHARTAMSIADRDDPTELLPAIMATCCAQHTSADPELRRTAQAFERAADRFGSRTAWAMAAMFAGLALEPTDPREAGERLSAAAIAGVEARAPIIESSATANLVRILADVDLHEAAAVLLPYLRDRAFALGDIYLQMAMRHAAVVLAAAGDREGARSLLREFGSPTAPHGSGAKRRGDVRSSPRPKDERLTTVGSLWTSTVERLTEIVATSDR